MRLRAWIAVLPAMAMPAAAQPAQAPFDPPLRAYSKLVAIMAACGQAYPVNRSRLEAYAAAMMEVANKAGATPAAIRTEYDRRAAELKVSGVRPWCMMARAGLREDGAAELFPDR